MQPGNSMKRWVEAAGQLNSMLGRPRGGELYGKTCSH
jgi:hypothetical protein